MCIAYIHFNPQHRWPLIIAANRDEFHARASAPAHYWAQSPDLLAGQDLQAQGTWLGLNQRARRFALLTNYRDLRETVPDDAISRGLLARDFLQSESSAASYLQQITAHSSRYAGFNLLLGEQLGQNSAALWYYSNRSQQPAQALPAGSYALSNHLLSTSWPKVQALKTQMDQLIERTADMNPEPFLHILQDRQPAADHELPNTGLEKERERLLSSIFIQSPDYGTRCSTVIMLAGNGRGLFTEQSYDPQGQWTDCLDWPLNFNF